MSKEDMIKCCFQNNTDKTRNELISMAVRRYKVAEGTAIKYYYEWKKEFVNNPKCVPNCKAVTTVRKNTRKSEKMAIVEDKDYGVLKQGEYIEYTILKKGIQVNNTIFKSWKDLENYKIRENNKINEIESIMRKTGNY